MEENTPGPFREKKLMGWLIVAIAMVLVVYMLNFCSQDFSKNPEAWGVFGDYVGGVINPITSLFLIIVTIRLQKALMSFTTFSSKQQEENQRVQFNTQLLHERANGFSKQASIILSSIEEFHHEADVDKAVAEVKKLKSFISQFMQLNQTYFFAGKDIASIVPYSHLDSYISIASSMGKGFFKDTDQKKLLEMVGLVVTVVDRHLFGAISERAKAGDLFNYD